jgi:hypothetical protein
LGEPGKRIFFDWPDFVFLPQVLATVIVQINTLLDVTITTTKYGTATSVSGLDTTGYVTDITDFWNSELGVTGAIVQDGTPTFTYKPTIYTALDKYITVTTVLWVELPDIFQIVANVPSSGPLRKPTSIWAS